MLLCCVKEKYRGDLTGVSESSSSSSRVREGGGESRLLPRMQKTVFRIQIREAAYVSVLGK